MRSFLYIKNMKLKYITKYDEVKVRMSLFVLIFTLSLYTFYAVVLLVFVIIVFLYFYSSDHFEKNLLSTLFITIFRYLSSEIFFSLKTITDSS
jgi:hypothetical protein